MNVLKGYCEKIDERINLRDASRTAFESKCVYDGRQGRPKYQIDHEQVEAQKVTEMFYDPLSYMALLTVHHDNF